VNIIIAVGVGGGIGAIARYLFMSACGRLCGTSFPWGTLGVNVIGCFIMGVLVEVMARRWSADQAMRALLTTGFLGGFTTFSTFSLDFAVLVGRGAQLSAALYVVASVALSLLAVFAGLILFRWLLPAT
jgi:CrcB protein